MKAWLKSLTGAKKRRRRSSGGHMGEEVAHQRPRPPGGSGGRRCAAVAEHDVALPLARVGADGKARMVAPPTRRGRRDRDAGVEREHAGLVGEQRIDVELAELRQVGGELRQLDQHERDLVASSPPARCGRPASRRATRVRAIRSRASFRSSGGSATALSSITSTPVPPWPNTMTGPKVGSSAMPSDQLARLRPDDHRLDRHAGDARVGRAALALAHDLGGGVAHRRSRRSG